MAAIVNHYEINVSLNGRHFFATANRSATTEGEAKRLFKELTQRFPESEGFKVEVSSIECTSYRIQWAQEVI